MSLYKLLSEISRVDGRSVLSRCSFSRAVTVNLTWRLSDGGGDWRKPTQKLRENANSTYIPTLSLLAVRR